MSQRTVAVVDYGMGNLRSVSQAVMHVAQGSGLEVVVTSRPEEVRAAERVVLPGQGAMRDCMRELHDSGLKDAVLEAAATKPLMGVCVGLIFNAVKNFDKPGTWSYIVSAMCAPALNTLFFMGYIVLAFYGCDYVQNLVSVKGAANPLMFVVLLVGVQGVAEFLVSGILGGIVARAVHKFLK